MQTYRLPNDGRPDVEFDGALIGRQSTDDKREQRQRWSECRIFRTRGGNYIGQRRGCSRVAGEVERSVVVIASTAQQLVDGLHFDDPDAGRILPRYVSEALMIAALVDPSVEAALVIRVD